MVLVDYPIKEFWSAKVLATEFAAAEAAINALPVALLLAAELQSRARAQLAAEPFRVPAGSASSCT